MFQVIFGIRKSQKPPNTHSGEKPFTCKECSKSFSEEKPFSSSLFTISLPIAGTICRRDYLLKGSQNFDTENLLCNLKIRTIPTFSLLHHFWHCPFLSSNMSLSMFWLLRRWLVTILQRIFEKLLSCQSLFQIVLARQLLWQCYLRWLPFIDSIKDFLEKIIMRLLINKKKSSFQSVSLNISAKLKAKNSHWKTSRSSQIKMKPIAK